MSMAETKAWKPSLAASQIVPELPASVWKELELDLRHSDVKSTGLNHILTPRQVLVLPVCLN